MKLSYLDLLNRVRPRLSELWLAVCSVTTVWLWLSHSQALLVLILFEIFSHKIKFREKVHGLTRTVKLLQSGRDSPNLFMYHDVDIR